MENSMEMLTKLIDKEKCDTHTMEYNSAIKMGNLAIWDNRDKTWAHSAKLHKSE